MTEPLEIPSLTELHERIIGLQRENSFLKNQLDQTRGELGTLKAELADLGGAFKAEVTNVTTEFKHVHRFLGDIHDQLWPLVHKVFPGSLATQQQIADIKRNGGRSPDDSKTS
jgi:hypothetical protein